MSSTTSVIFSGRAMAVRIPSSLGQVQETTSGPNLHINLSFQILGSVYKALIVKHGDLDLMTCSACVAMTEQ